MDNQNSTEKSVGFFSLSVMLHVGVVAAILAGAAYRATQSESEGSKGESVSMEMIDSGNAEIAAPAAEQVAATPAVEEKPEVQVQPVVQPKQVEKVVPVVAAKPVEKPVAKAKPVVAAKPVTKPIQKAKPAPNAIQTETQETEDAPAVAVAPPTPIEESVDAQAETEETVVAPTEPVQEPKAEEAAQPVAAVPPRPTAEAAQPEAVATAPTEQAAPATAAAAVTEGSGNGEGIAKGDGSGDTPEDAKAFTDVKQKPGNRTPKYPMNSRRAKQEGQVELMYFVTNQGTVDQIKVTKSSGFASLDQEAMQSVRNYKFYPGQEGWTTHPITFSLQGDAQQVGGLRHK